MIVSVNGLEDGSSDRSHHCLCRNPSVDTDKDCQIYDHERLWERHLGTSQGFTPLLSMCWEILENSLQRIKISFIFVVAAATCGRAIETFPLCGLRLPAQSLEMKGFEISVISTFKQNGCCRRIASTNGLSR